GQRPGHLGRRAGSELREVPARCRGANPRRPGLGAGTGLGAGHRLGACRSHRGDLPAPSRLHLSHHPAARGRDPGLNPPDTAPLVLVVEDDAAIAEGLALNLRLQGYRAAVAGDGDAAVLAIETDHPDLVLLDISLPKRSGISVLETVRGQGDQVPVIVLSARQDEFDKVAALRLGADDYVTKPFALAELLARVAAVLRRAVRHTRIRASADDAAAAAAASPVLRFGDVAVDIAKRTVTRLDVPVALTHLEFKLLSFLCQRAERV